MPFSDYEDILSDLGIRRESMADLRDYVDFLWDSNHEMNLFSRQMTFKELMENHIVDCCLPLRHLPQNLKTFADFGSGGGLPGVIYAIHFPKTKMFLFEKSPLKQSFLNKCRRYAPNLEIRGDIQKEMTTVQAVTSRAFKGLDVILPLSEKFYQSGGKYYLLKARREKINEEIELTKKKYPSLRTEILPLKSPLLDVERHLVIADKGQNEN